MSKLTAIRQQIAALEAQAERLAEREQSAAVDKIREIMSSFGLTLEQLQSALAAPKGRAAKRAGSRRGAGAAKYADPASGKTWSGLGRTPAWIAAAADRTVFLVGNSPSPSEGRSASKPAPTRKAAPGPAKARQQRKKATVKAAGKPTRKRGAAKPSTTKGPAAKAATPRQARKKGTPAGTKKSSAAAKVAGAA